MFSVKEKKIPTLGRSLTLSQNHTPPTQRLLGGLSAGLREKSCITKSCEHNFGYDSTFKITLKNVRGHPR